jgi:hypothetical protein
MRDFKAMANARRCLERLKEIERAIPPSVRRIFKNPKLYLPAVAMAYIIGLSSYLLVFFVDPYNLRYGGVNVKLSDEPYADLVMPRLAATAAKDGTDLVVIGGSTSMPFSTQMLRNEFSESKKPFNLSVLGIREADIEIILKEIEKSKTIQHVIVFLESTLLRNPRWSNRTQEMQYYDASWHNLVPEFNLEAVKLSATVARTGTLYHPSWRRKNPERPDYMLTSSPLSTRPEAMLKLGNAANISRAWVTSSQLIECEKIPAFRERILPSILRMAARGIKVDLAFAPYSLAVYSDWTVNFPDGYFFSGEGAVFAKLMSLRRCATLAVDGNTNIKIHAIDSDFTITKEINRYMDSSHIYDLNAFPVLLNHIRTGSTLITANEWQNYEKRMRNAIQNFKP